MKRWIVPVLLICLAPLPLFAADDGGSPLAHNKWALQFGIEQNLDVTAYEFGTVSFKRQMNPHSALRFGVAVHYENEAANDYFTSNTLTVLYQRYVSPQRPAKFYWGLGPTLKLDYGKREYTSGETYSQVTITRVHTGLLGAFGIEWFANDVISIHAEYRGGAEYTWSKQENKSRESGGEPQTKTYKSDLFDFRFANSVLFGASIYF